MLSSIACPLPAGDSSNGQPHATPDRRKRVTEAVYALCVFATGLLLVLTAV